MRGKRKKVKVKGNIKKFADIGYTASNVWSTCRGRGKFKARFYDVDGSGKKKNDVK